MVWRILSLSKSSFTTSEALTESVVPTQNPSTMPLLTWAAPGVSQFPTGTGREPYEECDPQFYGDNWVRVQNRCLWTAFLRKQQTALTQEFPG